MAKQTGLIFQGWGVRSIFINHKTMTRRTRGLKSINADPDNWISDGWAFDRPGGIAMFHSRDKNLTPQFRCPYGGPGDHLWVREAHWIRPERTPSMMREGASRWPPILYSADGDDDFCRKNNWKRGNALYMPRSASRATLELTEVRVERLHDMDDFDCVQEGLDLEVDHAMPKFIEVWDTLNGAGSYNANPWVWVLVFRLIDNHGRAPQ